MRIVTAEELSRILDYRALVEALDEAFRADIAVPVRHHHTIPQPGTDATLLLMPAWTQSGRRFIGCKVVTVFPDNAEAKRPSVHGQYLLMSGDTGEPLALIEGRMLTALRTACASALAARYLAREDASHLVMIGAGALAPHLVRAHAAVRPIRRVTVWNRTNARAVALGFALAEQGFVVDVSDDLAVVRDADIVSCATLSREPLVRGGWLTAGTHVDLVGGFTPAMREADDEALRRARVFVDTRDGALKEAGDLVDPLARGVIKEGDVRGDLFDLCRGRSAGRETREEITLFKSVGTAIEDLAAAVLAWNSLS
ncbi:MAG TPA: ornithine cyclodeaminase family protein [Pseudorhodoplanes sp.]|nr:ornithine cyclodeaminase family protein [Pseudorhodoplanes sp.]